MCLLDLPVASMCQLHTHTHIQSHALPCSTADDAGVGRLESGVTMVVRRSTPPPTHMQHKQQQQTQTCCAQLALQRMVAQSTIRKKVIVHCYFCSYSTLSSRCCCCCCYNVNLARELSAASVCGHFVVGIFQKFHVFLYYFCICLRHGTHTLSHQICMTRGTVRDIERERKSVCESVEPKTQTNSSSNKAQEITNI